jgi:SAM-dependent methyltransferase
MYWGMDKNHATPPNAAHSPAEDTMSISGIPRLEKHVADYKGRVFAEVYADWLRAVDGSSKILKVDLFEEANDEGSAGDWLQNRFDFVCGADTSGKNIHKASRSIPGIMFVNAEAWRLPFKQGIFGAVVCNAFIGHLPQDNVLMVLREFSRVLTRGGTLILTVDNAHNRLYSLGFHIGKRLGGKEYHPQRCYFKREVTGLLEDSGFSVEHTLPVFHVLPGYNLLARHFRLNRAGGAYRGITHMGRLFYPKNRYTACFLAFRAVNRTSSAGGAHNI